MIGLRHIHNLHISEPQINTTESGFLNPNYPKIGFVAAVLRVYIDIYIQLYNISIKPGHSNIGFQSHTVLPNQKKNKQQMQQQ